MPEDIPVSVAASKARLAGLIAHRDPADPDITEAKRDLAAAKLERHIREVVDGAPPLTAEQLGRLALLLRSAAPSHAEAV